MTVVDVLVGYVEAVEAVSGSADVWAPLLAVVLVGVAGWRLRPRGGRHRTPSAPWASARTTGRTVVRTVVGTVRAVLVRLRPPSPDAPPVSCADGRPAVPADGRPPEGGREAGSG